MKGSVLVPVELLERVSHSLGAFVSNEGWAQTDMDTMDDVDAHLAQAAAPRRREPDVPEAGFGNMEPVAYSVGRTLHWHAGRGVDDAQLYAGPPRNVTP